MTVNRCIAENVNRKSDDYLLTQFYHEFRDVVSRQIIQNNKVYFVAPKPQNPV